MLVCMLRVLVRHTIQGLSAKVAGVLVVCSGGWFPAFQDQQWECSLQAVSSYVGQGE